MSYCMFLKNAVSTVRVIYFLIKWQDEIDNARISHCLLQGLNHVIRQERLDKTKEDLIHDKES